MMVSVSLVDDKAHRPVYLAHGLRMVVRDMGNGVVRVVASGVISRADAEGFEALPDVVRVPFPCPGWMSDAALYAIRSNGIDWTTDMQGKVMVTRCARYIDDDTVEIVSWYDE